MLAIISNALFRRELSVLKRALVMVDFAHKVLFRRELSVLKRALEAIYPPGSVTFGEAFSFQFTTKESVAAKLRGDSQTNEDNNNNNLKTKH